jgi:glycosyltransferase involved in cell wall biosynthesis
MLADRLDGTGGTAFRLARDLAELGYEVHAITNYGERIYDISVKWHPIFHNLFDPRTLPALFSNLRKIKPDLIHLFGGPPTSLIGVTLRKTQIPVIQTLMTVHPRKYVTPLSILETSMFHNLFLMSVRRLDFIICHSQYVLEFLHRIGIPYKKMTVIHPGVFFHGKEHSSEKMNISLGKNAVLFWTSGYKERGIETFLEAIPYVSNEIPDASFYIAVLDFYRAERARKTAFELARKTRRLLISENPRGRYTLKKNGNYLQMNIYDFIASSTIITLPFRVNPQEPPFSLLESMAFGKAVITTNIGSNREVIRNNYNGVLIEPNDSYGLAEAITRLLSDQQQRKRIGEAARKFIKNNFDWEKYLSLTLRVYEEI